MADTGRLLTRHPADPQGVADRRGRHRQGGDGRRGRDPEARDARTRRQVAAHRLRRRRPRQRRRRRAARATSIPPGEVCSNGTRVFVHARLKSAFVERLRGARRDDAHRRSARSGHAGRRADLARSTCARCSATSSAGAPRARALLDRRRARRRTALSANGCFVEPTVFDGCPDDMAIVREEIFGPVMAVLDVRRRGRGRRARQRDRVRPRGRRLHARPDARAPRHRAAARPAPAGSTTTT